MIYLVYYEDPDTSTGISFTGIFDNKIAAKNFAESEGPNYKVFETTFGPIAWGKIDPYVPFDWDNL